MFINGKFYVAYADHHWASPSDIKEYCKPYDTYAEACKAGEEMLVDDDNYKVYYRIDDKWFELEWIAAEEYPNVPRVPSEAKSWYWKEGCKAIREKRKTDDSRKYINLYKRKMENAIICVADEYLYGNAPKDVKKVYNDLYLALLTMSFSTICDQMKKMKDFIENNLVENNFEEP